MKDLGEVNSNKWYVPGAGEWDSALKYLGIDDPAHGFDFSSQETNAWGGSLGYRLQEVLFYQANGVPLTGWYWAANDWKTDNIHKGITVTAGAEGAHFGGARKTDRTKVRPFINY